MFLTRAVNCTDSEDERFALLGLTWIETAVAGAEDEDGVLLCIGAACKPEQAIPETRVRSRKETAQ